MRISDWSSDVCSSDLGPLVSFQTGWLYYVARVTALAANTNVFAIYAATLWAPLGTAAGRAATILALCGTLTFVNIVGVIGRASCRELVWPYVVISAGAVSLKKNYQIKKHNLRA